jgi:hypothetical protein
MEAMHPVRPLTLSLFAAALLIPAASLTSPLHAQDAKTITVLVFDGKTGRPIVPDNYVVRVDHLNATHNEWLTIKDDGTATVAVPAKSSFFSVQTTYHRSMDFYVNCDAGMEKDTSTLHWYSVADILASGVSSPNECYKGKFAEATHVAPKPGQFVVYVRPINARESLAD